MWKRAQRMGTRALIWLDSRKENKVRFKLLDLIWVWNWMSPKQDNQGKRIRIIWFLMLQELIALSNSKSPTILILLTDNSNPRAAATNIYVMFTSTNKVLSFCKYKYGIGECPDLFLLCIVNLWSAISLRYHVQSKQTRTLQISLIHDQFPNSFKCLWYKLLEFCKYLTLMRNLSYYIWMRHSICAMGNKRFETDKNKWIKISILCSNQ